MSDKTYNGWTNYETWAVGMYLDGNYDGEGTYRHVLDISRENACQGTYEVAQAIEEFFGEVLPELEGIAADLLGGAVSEVNWHELGEHKYNEVVEEWTSEAREEGKRTARNVASWITDGNDTDESRRRKLQMIEDGEIESVIRYPNLSGEFADDPTPQSLAEEITGCDDVEAELVDKLAEAFEDGVSEVFEEACVTELKNAIGEEV